jgi:bifunctional DNase/RNase
VSEDFKDIFGDWQPSDDGPADDTPIGERKLNEKEVKVVGVFEHAEVGSEGSGPQTFVLLQDRRERKVPIWIGRFEAFAISTALQGEQLDRPMTHDLLKTTIERLGATVDRVIVDDLWQETFYAKLILQQHDQIIEIDCRPSDAIALAVRTKAPLFVAESVFETVSPPE